MQIGWSFYALGFAAACTVLAPRATAQAEKKPARYNVMAAGYYVREDKDREWHLRITGEIPSLCGAYVVIHDAAGRAIYHGAVPHGKYPPEKPFIATIRPDGITGDYKIIMLGHQDDMLGVLAPWTDLPLEVYGGGSMSVGHNPAARLWFKAPEGVTKMSLGAYKAHLKVFDAAGNLIADTRNGRQEKYDHVIEFDVTPGAAYQLAPETMYFRSYTPNVFFFALQPDSWFMPSPELDKVKWWELVK